MAEIMLMQSAPSAHPIVRIDILPEDAFENFVQINELSLSHNPIKTIGEVDTRTRAAHTDLIPLSLI
jgi:hypothetical protein